MPITALVTYFADVARSIAACLRQGQHGGQGLDSVAGAQAVALARFSGAAAASVLVYLVFGARVFGSFFQALHFLGAGTGGGFDAAKSLLKISRAFDYAGEGLDTEVADDGRTDDLELVVETIEHARRLVFWR